MLVIACLIVAQRVCWIDKRWQLCLTLHLSHCTLRNSHYTLQTSHFTLHTATLHTTHITLHASHYAHRTSLFTLHPSHCTFRTSHFTLQTTHCALHGNTALFTATLRTTHIITIHASYFTRHTAHMVHVTRQTRLTSQGARHVDLFYNISIPCRIDIDSISVKFVKVTHAIIVVAMEEGICNELRGIQGRDGGIASLVNNGTTGKNGAYWL